MVAEGDRPVFEDTNSHRGATDRIELVFESLERMSRGGAMFRQGQLLRHTFDLSITAMSELQTFQSVALRNSGSTPGQNFRAFRAL